MQKWTERLCVVQVTSETARPPFWWKGESEKYASQGDRSAFDSRLSTATPSVHLERPTAATGSTVSSALAAAQLSCPSIRFFSAAFSPLLSCNCCCLSLIGWKARGVKHPDGLSDFTQKQRVTSASQDLLCVPFQRQNNRKHQAMKRSPKKILLATTNLSSSDTRRELDARSAL